MALLLFGIIWLVYGFAGFLGIQSVPDKYKDHSWTRDYTRSRGFGWILLGGLWILLYMMHLDMQMLSARLLIVLFSIPSFVCWVQVDRKFQHLLDEETEEKKKEAEKAKEAEKK